jgi:hypothetical protein
MPTTERRTASHQSQRLALRKRTTKRGEANGKQVETDAAVIQKNAHERADNLQHDACPSSPRGQDGNYASGRSGGGRIMIPRF